MLKLQHIFAGYPGNNVLSDLSLSLPEGSFTVVIGPNGSGKSTLLKAMAGLLPCRGQLLFRGDSLSTLSAAERAKQIAFLPQSRPVPEITAQRLILHGRFPYLSYPRHYRREDHAAAEKAMEQLGISHLAQRPLATLSGGERQKIYIAMLLAQGSPVVLMDEPTGALDISHKFELIQLARQMIQAGKTVIAVLHELDLALSCADQVVLMDQGQIRISGTADDVYASGLLDAVFQIRTQRLETGEGVRYLFHPLSGQPFI